MPRSTLSCSFIGFLLACGSKPPPAPAAPPEVKPLPVTPAPAPARAAPVPPPPSAAHDLANYCRAELAAAQTSLDQLIAVTGARTIDNTLEPFNEVMRHTANAAY